MRCRWLSPMIAAGMLLGWGGHAQAPARDARAVLEMHSDAIVTVRIVVKERWIYRHFEDDSSEYAAESTAFTVSDDGTVVTSLAATDPEVFYAHWFDDDDGFQIRTELTSLTLIYPSGEEVPAEVVLRDRDLDLIFIRSIKRDAPKTRSIPLETDAAAESFDPVIRLFRFNHTFKRACGGDMGHVQAVVDHPRRLYSITNTGSSELGSPVFLPDGRLLGMTAFRQLNKSATSERGFQWFSEDSNSTVVVVSASDIAEAAAQLPARK